SLLTLNQVRHLQRATTRTVRLWAEVVLNPPNQVSTRFAEFRPANHSNQKGSRAISHHGRDRHKPKEYAKDVIANQPHDDGPRDYESPVLQLQPQELGSDGERPRNGFESKRHGSACESAKELQNR